MHLPASVGVPTIIATVGSAGRSVARDAPLLSRPIDKTQSGFGSCLPDNGGRPGNSAFVGEMQIDGIRQLGPGRESNPGARLRNILKQAFEARLVGRDDDPARPAQTRTA